MLKKTISSLTLALFASFAQIGTAQDLGSFEISKQGTTNPYQVALIPFAGNKGVSDVIFNNLNYTELKTNSQNLPAQGSSSADFTQNRLAWEQAGYPYVVTGNIQNIGNNKAAINFEVIEVATGRVINGRQTQVADATQNGLRYAAHVVSDKIYELITGNPGDFSGRIAYVEETGDPRNKTSTLKVMDADGQNAMTVFSVQGSIFSPTWSSDGRTLAYAVQRPNGLPVIYVQSVDGGGQRLVTPFKGNNLGPSFSPDGSSLIFSGSHENNDPAIYEVHTASGMTKKLTNMTGAENSPSYAPDGRSFVFTADNGTRTPQLYRYNVGTGQASRIASGMASNPRMSPDGTKVAFVAGSTLSVMNLNGGNVQSIAPTSIHESATFSPNSSRIAFASGQGITIRHLGTGQSFTKTGEGRIREPAWSAPRR